MKKILKNLIILLAVIGISTGGYFFYKKKFHQNPEDQYKVQEISIGSVEQSVSANGTINPVTLVSVGTQVSGIVKKLYVDFNDKVQKGQVLLELDDALLKAQIGQSTGNVKNAAASLELAKANEARTRSLYAQEYASKQDLDNAVQVMKSASAQLEVARAQLQRDNTNLAYSIIRSPVSGVVVDREVDVGQTVAASFQTPTLIKIAQDLSNMQIDTTFAEADIGNVKVGQKAKFSVDAYPSRDFEGVVKQIRLNPTNTANVVTYDVVITVDNPDQVLLPGMTAYVNIIFAKHEHVKLVPNAALRYKPKFEIGDNKADKNDSRNKEVKRGHEKVENDGLTRGKVYVLDKGKPLSKHVKVGITDGKLTEIVSDELKEGDKIIIGNTQQDNKPSSSGSNMRPPRMF
jgi:HlyD family secretion protein